MDMVRMRISRVKEMLLLSGLPRSFFWISNGIAHLILYSIAFTISMVQIRDTEMLVLWGLNNGASW